MAALAYDAGVFVLDISELKEYYPVIFTVITVTCLILYILNYIKISLPASGTTEWISRVMEKRKFTIFYKRHGMERRDILPVVIITAVCAFLGFWGLGDTTAPRSFHKFTPDKATVYVRLDEPADIGRLMYYTGLWTGSYTLEFSGDGTNWQRQYPKKKDQTPEAGQSQSPAMDQPHSDLFKWLYADINADNVPTKFIRITASRTPITLGEVALYTKSGEMIAAGRLSSDAPELIDEQQLVPDKPSYMNSMYFDEIYHGRTAYEYTQGVKVYETTHPPLGKLILTVGIQLFGMVPFGWRFMGTLFGVLMLPVLYIFLKNMFGKTPVAACGTILFGADFMHFVQTRIATIDTYGVFFILLSYFFMYRFMTSDPEKKFGGTLPSLALSGLFFGIGCACKWTVIYAGAGLFVLFVLRLVLVALHYRKGGIPGYAGLLFKTLFSALVFFIVIPAAFYCASYIPNGILDGMRVKDGMLWDPKFYKLIWDNQKYMFNYHSTLVATHSYASCWYQWIVDGRPILYYRSIPAAGFKSEFASFGNPIVWWGGFLAIIGMIYRFFKFRDGKALFILIGYLSQLVPCFFITRVLFIYHYFPSVLFLVLALSHMLDTLWERARGRYKPAVYGLTGFTVLLFIAFYPVLTGVPAADTYIKYCLLWLPDGPWPF